MSDQALVAQQPVAVVTVETEAGPSVTVATQQVGAFVAAAGQGAAGRDGRDGGGLGAEQVVRVQPTTGQTVFPLTVPPTQLSSVEFTVNGATYRNPYVNADATKAIWNNSGFQLEPSDDVVITYF